jgi:probable HAF family extracellular repeat protein
MSNNPTRTGRMTSRPALCAVAGLIGALALIPSEPASASPHTPRYELVDVGTFGGPHAELEGPAVQITKQGAVLGLADTPIPDADYPNDGAFGGDPYILHAFAWQHARLTDLGALPGNNSSAVFEVNGAGVGAGGSETGVPDPLTGQPALHAAVFDHGTVTDLGTLPGGTEGFAVAINDRGQIAGIGNNGVAGPGFPEFFDWITQIRSFVWQDGAMRDLGTLGGPGTVMNTLNASGQIAGDSYTNSTPNPATGYPTIHPFLWTDGHMRDLGTLGGTLSTTSWLNNTGEVVGQSNVTGDQATHPFLWDGTRLRDLVGLGGDYGVAWHINDTGDVIGWASPASNDTIHAFEWKHGMMTDLTGGGNEQCTFAEGINNAGQVVGGSCDGAALLWDNGTQYDLNALVAPSDAQLTEASYIDDRGEIAAIGDLPNGHQHVFLLRPAPGQPGTRADTRPHRSNTGTQHRCGDWLPPRAVAQLAKPRTAMPYHVTHC